MVVLSAAITTKTGKALMARQFVDMSRIRIEGLLAAFPKLMGTGNKQHTFIETESVRYVYQPMEALFLLLITNKGSNIVEDLETLRMLSKVVPDVAGGVTEEKVTSKAFELVFAFDEVISVGGLRESVTLLQIKSNLAMDSHEERLHNMIQDTKREAAKDEAARKASELRARQRAMQAAGGAGMTGIQGGMGNSSSSYDLGISGMPPYSPTVESASYSNAAPQLPTAAAAAAAAASSNRVPAKGMKLGGAGSKNAKKNTMLDSLMAEERLAPVPMVSSSSGGGAGAAAAAAVPAAVASAVPAFPVSVVIEEKLSAQLTREGALEALEVKGTLSLTANSEDAARCKIVLAPPSGTGAASGFNPNLNYQTHPKVNKALYESSRALALKDSGKGFPVARPVGVLRWSLTSSEEAAMPLTVNCWPEEEGGGVMSVNIEYTLQSSLQELQDVSITIPLGCSEVPKVQAVDGQHRHNAQANTLIWYMESIDQSNASGSLEFTLHTRDAEAFFPIQIQFMSSQLFASVAVAGVTTIDGDLPVQYGLTSSLTTENYLCC